MQNNIDLVPKLTPELIKRLENKLSLVDDLGKEYYSSPCPIFTYTGVNQYLFLAHIREGEPNKVLFSESVALKDIPESLEKEITSLRNDSYSLSQKSYPIDCESIYYIKDMLDLIQAGVPFDINEYTRHIYRVLKLNIVEPNRKELEEEAQKLVKRFEELYSQYLSHSKNSEPRSPEKFFTISKVDSTEVNTKPYLGTFHFLFIALVLLVIITLLPK